MKNKLLVTFILVSILPIGANATGLKQFNVSCTFLKNAIEGTNTTGGEIIKADPTAVHQFSVDLNNRNICDSENCITPTPFVSVAADIITTSKSGSDGVPDVDGDVYELDESLNIKTDVFTLMFTYYDDKNSKQIGSSKIEYKCEILPFER